MWYDDMTQLVGGTPLVKLNKINAGLKPTILVKLEMFNPGGSSKDRIAITMIDAAEKSGALKPGGTIIEGTSGNTGLGLAITACIRGYRCIFTTTDKQSQEKVNLLKAFGAEVLVCPTAVEPDDPRSYYSVAKRLAEEIPNSVYPNQYYNEHNPRAHYEATGPEIWEQTEGKITHFVAGLGTGGTITGVGRYLKEKNPDIKIIGADPIGSIYKHYFDTGGEMSEAHTYKVEGIGEDIIPSTIDFDVIDEVIQVTDKDSFLVTREVCKSEGMFVGGSCGSALVAAFEVARNLSEDDLMVVLLPDHGDRYLSKIYNDEWMRENQYVQQRIDVNGGELVRRKAPGELQTIAQSEPAAKALELMKQHDISQIPVTEAPDSDKLVGAVREDKLIDMLLDQHSLDVPISQVMGEPLPVVTNDTSIERISDLLTRKSSAVLVETGEGLHIVTKFDLIHGLQVQGS